MPDLNARSPWSKLNSFKEVKISPSRHPIVGNLIVPGSKSFTNRVLIIAALADGQSQISSVLKSDDTFWCINALQALGVHLELEGNNVLIEGVNGKWPVKDKKLYIGAAGTTARFLPGALAADTSGCWTIEASERMSQRPLRPLIDALKVLGAKISYDKVEGFFPITVEGSGLQGGEVNISGDVSSQFISGLLIASSYAQSTVTINIIGDIVQPSYVEITLDVMKRFGVSVEFTNPLQRMIIEPQKYVGQIIQVEADASTCCYFLALAAITGGKVKIDNLSYTTNQPDIKMLDLFERMGCIVQKGSNYIEVQGTGQLKGGFSISMKEMSDQAVTLAAIAPFADGPISITDVAHIRTHESDRIKAICEALSKMEIIVEEREDGLTVYPGKPKPALLNSYDDHRLAMSLSLIGAVIEDVRILDPGCVSKTCPTFFDHLSTLGLDVTFTD